MLLLRRCTSQIGRGVAFVLVTLLGSSLAAAGSPPPPASTFSLQIVHRPAPGTLNDIMPSRNTCDGSPAALDWNVDYHRPAENRTDVCLRADERFLYVTFAAHQREPIVATRRTENTSGNESDDFVAAYVWPSGPNGFRYEFSSNSLGTRYQESTENAAFTPQWTTLASRTSDGYEVAMRIPLDAMRGDGRDVWRLQFSRGVIATLELNEWAHSLDQSNEHQVVYAGYLSGMRFAARLTRAKPRIGLYALGRQTGSETSSLAGADIALPVTQTASFVGTIHPDYSNVELDQQTITPTEFVRVFQEVRPFFTQGAQFYNQFTSIANPGNTMLYTPAIPTPRRGYALEGTQGNVGFGLFDAVGSNRDDNAALPKIAGPMSPTQVKRTGSRPALRTIRPIRLPA